MDQSFSAMILTTLRFIWKDKEVETIVMECFMNLRLKDGLSNGQMSPMDK